MYSGAVLCVVWEYPPSPHRPPWVPRKVKHRDPKVTQHKKSVCAIQVRLTCASSGRMAADLEELHPMATRQENRIAPSSHCGLETHGVRRRELERQVATPCTAAARLSRRIHPHTRPKKMSSLRMLLLSSALVTGSMAQRPTLNFKADGTFKILQVADSQVGPRLLGTKHTSQHDTVPSLSLLRAVSFLDHVHALVLSYTA